MDGAAIGVMGILASRFPTMLMQRCATHAFSLIIGDIALFFPETSQFVHELVAFCFAHSKLVHILRCMNGPMLSRPVETRMGSFVLACERILSGRGELEELITARHTVEAVKSSRSKKGLQWAPRGAQQALRRVLGKVLGPGAVSAALSEHRKFLLGDDGFSDIALQELGKEDSAEAYWFEVKREGIAPILAPVALKLCTAYSGQ
ncbi:hypothetical protein NFJ02_03g104540 [Pycnococcus provasolii]